jgi:hypothetical protein
LVTTRPDAVPSPRRSGIQPITLLIVVGWLVAALPRLLNTLLTVKHRSSVGDTVSANPIANLTQQILNLLMLALCLWILAKHLRHLPTERRLSLVIMIAPFVYLISRDLYVGVRPQVSVMIYPLLVLAIWSLQPRLEQLALTGWLTALFCVLNLVLGLAMPDKGLFTSATGDLIAPEKQILSIGILVGIFTQGNLLGVFLVLAVPAVALIRSPVARVLIFGLTGFCLVWTSSRSSLAGFVLMLGVFLLTAVLRASGRGLASAVVLLLCLAAVPALPLTAHTYGAYTNRGYIWQISLSKWSTEPWFGLGSHWYNQIGHYVNPLPGTAFHGHNLFVHGLVTGGVSYVVLLTLMIGCLMYYAIAWAIRGVAYPTAFLVCFLVSCTLEVPFGVVDDGYLFAVTVLPMAVVVFAPLTPSPLARQIAPVSTIISLSAIQAEARVRADRF